MRTATLADKAAIMGALIDMLHTSTAPQMKFASVEKAAFSVGQAILEKRAYIMGGFFVMVDVGEDWYSEERYLIEQIILRINDDRRFKVEDVIAVVLPTAAQLHSCVAIAAGDTQIGYMTPKYHAAGYQTLGTQLFKEMPNGIRSQGDGGQRTS